ncbi:hypothetical protein [Mycobacterium simulans]|uniref:hypothetical protein n=1 Tax=Mycobacterium simulans TaxID=627089 RepID=UPI001CD52757|nr:hypothetical protein [Mycobacterium simulans]
MGLSFPVSLKPADCSACRGGRQAKGVKSSASVGRAAITELHPDTAKVLVFLNQVTVSQDRPDPVQAATSGVARLTKVDGSWLISVVDPI